MRGSIRELAAEQGADWVRSHVGLLRAQWHYLADFDSIDDEDRAEGLRMLDDIDALLGKPSVGGTGWVEASTRVGGQLG